MACADLPHSISLHQTSTHRPLNHSLPYSPTALKSVAKFSAGPAFQCSRLPSFCCRPASFVACSPRQPFTNEPHSDSDSDSDSDRTSEQHQLQELPKEALAHEEDTSSTPLPRCIFANSELRAQFEHRGTYGSGQKQLSKSPIAVYEVLMCSFLLSPPSEEISWLLVEDEDVPTMVSNLSITERYAPQRLLEFVSKKLDSQMFSLAQLKSTLKFWQKKEKLQDDQDPSFGSSAFEGKKGVSQVHQWTATELTLQHAQLSRIARDVLYLILACSLLGVVRVLEALVATFSSSPPHFKKLLDATNSLDFFTVAFLAYSLRKPIIGLLRVDPTNLDEIVQLRAKIWDEMHNFYERQWKVIATLGVGRLLAMIAQTLPSTNAMTKSVKMCWDMLLALPIF